MTNSYQDIESERILIKVSTMENPDRLREIGKAAASRLKELGVGARWEQKRKRKAKGEWLLKSYLSVSPFILALLLIVPLVYNLSVRFITSNLFDRWFPGPNLVSYGRFCPPLCSWQDLAFFAIVGGIGLPLSFLAGNALRKRLMNSIDTQA